MDLTLEDAADYLIVRIEGEWTADTMREAIKDTAKAARQRGFRLILADCRRLHAPKTEFSRFEAGQDVARYLARDFKVAVLYPKDFINQFAEDVAVNRGASMGVFSDLDEALSWLKERRR